MADLGPVAWPPEPIRTERLVLREPALPGEPVVLFTQTANARSMRLAAKLGFTEVERCEAYGAEQWFGMWSPVTPSRLSSCSPGPSAGTRAGPAIPLNRLAAPQRLPVALHANTCRD